MKIKKLVIENINSLYGHFEIDFDSPSFANGIFAITGPTGSGKTTILDAMCLALFGITPRLKSGERGEALSKGTAKGLAELTFEVDEKVYLASCAMTPSSVKHTISCNEVILESSVRNTPGKVREILGLTMEQFCRAVLLAQGKFDAFLEAGVKDKADILEQITGTEMYSKIAGKANQIYRQLKHQVEQEEAVSQAWQILDKDTELQKRSELEELNKQNIFVSGSYEKLNKLLTDFGKIASTEKLLLDNRQAQDILAREKADFTVDARRLVSGEKAVRLQPAFTAWKTCHQEYTANCQKAENLTTVLPELEKKKNAIFQHLQEIQEKCTVLKKEDEELIALTGKVLVLDNTLSQKQTGVEITRKKLLQSLEKQKEQNEALRDLETQLKILDEEKTGWLQYLEEHKNDQALSAQKARWQEQMLQVSSLQNQERSCQTELKKLQQALKKKNNFGKKPLQNKGH